MHEFYKKVKYTQTIHQLLQMNYLSVFNHFVGLALKGLSDCNGTGTHNHLVHKQTLNHLANLKPVLSQEFLDNQATIECGFTLKSLHDMIRTYNQMYHTDKYSQHSSIQVLLQSLKLQISRLFQARSSLTFRQL